MTFFEGLQEKKANFIWRIHEQFLNDTSNQKVDLTVGAYRDNNGKPYVFKAIKNAEHQILNDEKIFKEYTGPEGVPLFDELAQKFLFGDCISYREGRIATVQSIAGTGSLKLCADFLKANFYNKIKKVYISDPTWIPHRIIFEAAGFLVEDYPYYSKETATVMINEMIEKFYAADNNSLVILHPCAHNPTGLDLTEFEWKQIAQTIKEKNLMVLFDIAYQGFASGSTDEDAWPVRYFEKMGFEFLVTQSFSKNMGLYGERIGALHMVTFITTNLGNFLILKLKYIFN
uniref:Aspartate aminotransferase n=1 Tax=Nephromyces sp. MMRI TaxID=2496275 RepID=A0A3S8V350_9APIC|nr:cytosolic aspartate aminotransferase [Nephromyces sp. MMRI]